MTVTYDATSKTNRITASRDTVANGTLEICTAAYASVLVTFGLSASGGTISGDTWTLVLDASTVAAGNSGTAAVARIKDSGGTARITGLTVGQGSGEVNLDSTTINAGQNVTLNSAAIQHA